MIKRAKQKEPRKRDWYARGAAASIKPAAGAVNVNIVISLGKDTPEAAMVKARRSRFYDRTDFTDDGRTAPGAPVSEDI